MTSTAVIERTFDADFFNGICNLPEVRPGLGGGDAPLDVGPLLSNPSNYALRTEHGGFILVAQGAGFYSVHTQFAAKGRGPHAIAAMQAGLAFMFLRTDCMRINSHCPDNNPPALALARAGHAKDWFRCDHPQYGPGVTVQWDIFDWLVANPDLEPAGHQFHETLERAKVVNGSLLPTHPDDPIHDRVVGGAFEMCRNGQAAKGALCYNLWAAAAGYAPVRPISLNPPILDVGDGIVALDAHGDLEVLQCR